MAKELVTVAKYNDYMQASLVKQMLDDAGIPAVILGEGVADMFPGAVPIEIKVEEDHLEEASQIIDAYNEAQQSQQQPEIDGEEGVQDF
jgi:hypothetical protein